MANTVKILKSLKTSTTKASNIDKVLCILEGKLELNLIYKLYELLGYSRCCDELSKDKIKVAWGKSPVIINNCNFNGGNQPNLKTPKPATEAFKFYKNKINKFNAVVVLFDGDLDNNSEVENFFKTQLPSVSIDNLLIVSQPCFEKTLIDFCTCGNCLTQVMSFPSIPTSKCKKYKSKFSSLNCFRKFTNSNIVNRCVNSDSLVENLDSSNISSLSKTSSLFKLNSIISKYK